MVVRDAAADDEHPSAKRDGGHHKWKVGDRVIAHSLKKASHLNGQHGCIGGVQDATTGRYPVDFDLPPHHNGGGTRSDGGGSGSHRVMAKAENLKPEPVLPLDEQKHQQHHLFHRAPVADGILAQEEGRPLCLLLDAIRFLVGNVIHQDPQVQNGLSDVERLRRQGQFGLERIHHYMQSAWFYWDRRLAASNDDDDNDDKEKLAATTEIRPSVYLLLLQFFDELPTVNDAELAEMPNEFHVARAALYHRTAVQGWDTRIHGDFWVVMGNKLDEKEQEEADDGGTYCVSELNHHAVYKVFGLRTSLSDALTTDTNEDDDDDDNNYDRSAGSAILVTVTLLPWYGRLVYDGTCTLAQGSNNDEDGSPAAAADEPLVQQLRQNVILARKEGRVVEHIAQLHFDAFMEQQDRAQQQQQQQRDDSGDVREEEFSAQGREQLPVLRQQQQQADPTEEEWLLLEELVDIDVASADEAIWCMRRVGYAEQDNPNHEGIIINGAAQGQGTMIGRFACSALNPTAEDILQALVDYTHNEDDESSSSDDSDEDSEAEHDNNKMLPAVVLIDDEECFERVQFLLENFTAKDFRLEAMYYPPPTQEETEAALADIQAD